MSELAISDEAAVWRLPTLRDVDHVGVTVPDREEAVAFFTDVLGAQLLMTGGAWSDPEGESFARVLGVHREALIRVAMLRLGPGTTLELVEFTTPDQRRVMPVLSDWGAAHIALRVDDIDQAARALRARGLVVLDGPMKNGPGPIDGSSYLYFRTPWGMPMELAARAGRHPYEGPGCHPHPAAPRWDWRPPGEIETEVVRVETAVSEAGETPIDALITELTVTARAMPGTLDYWWRASEADPARFISYQRFVHRAGADAVNALASRHALARVATLTSDTLILSQPKR